MDLHTVSRYRFARTRDDLRLADGESFVAGGTWTFSEPQAELAGVVDLTTMDWCPIERTGDGLRIAATCTIAELVRHPRRAEWPAQQLFGDCANALLASFKIWNVATVGGNICRSFAAASMVSLAVALDGVAEIWTPDGQTRWDPVADLITGNGTNSLSHGEVLRALHLPERALRSRAALRRSSPVRRPGRIRLLHRPTRVRGLAPRRQRGSRRGHSLRNFFSPGGGPCRLRWTEPTSRARPCIPSTRCCRFPSSRCTACSTCWRSMPARCWFRSSSPAP